MSTISKVLCANNAVGTLQGLHSASTTEFALSGSQGDKFPVIADGNCFYMTIEDTLGHLEVVKVTARTGDTLTVVRGQSGTTAREWANGTEVSLRATAELIDDKVDWKKYTVDMAGKLDRGGTSSMTGAMTFQNTAEIKATDGTNTNTLSFSSTGAPLFNGQHIALLMYPVGAIYSSYVSTDPGTLFGGTWVRIGAGRCLIDASDAAGDYPPGTQGGNAKHTLTVNELAAHSHGGSTSTAANHTHTRGTMEITGSFMHWDATVRPIDGAFWYGGETQSKDGDSGRNTHTGCMQFTASRSWSGETSASGGHSHTVTIANSGGGDEFDIMNPYLAIYMWRRTA